VKIVHLHNYYQQRGGEDGVFEAEVALLREKGHEVETLIFNNMDIQSAMDKLSAGVGIFHNAGSMTRLNKLLGAFKPDILHVHNFFPLASPGVFYAARQAGVPVVMTLHNYRLVCANGLLFREGKPCELCLDKKFPTEGIRYGCYRGSRLETAALSAMTSLHRAIGTWRHRVDHYIALTQFSREKIMGSALRLSDDQISVKPNFIPDPGMPKNRRENFMLFVGRLTPEKGIQHMLAAWQGLDIPLKIAGTGPLLPEVQKAAQESSHIEVLGFCDKEEIMSLMQCCRGLVFPSIWYEGFPVTLLEALSTGTPVICSNIGGLPEIIEDQQQGLLFEPGDSIDLKLKVRQLGQDDNLHEQLCLNAREKYLFRYAPEKNYAQLLAIYQKLIQPIGTLSNEKV